MSAANAHWLPDFCRLSRLAAVLGIAELVVVIIALSPSRSPGWSVQEFVAASVFAQWIALSAAVLLCKARGALLRLPRYPGMLVASAVPALVAAFGAWALHQIDLGLGYGLSLPAGQAWSFVLGIAALSALIAALALRYFYVREQWQAQVTAHAQASVDALQARIRPHFLFNSMNTIASLVRSNPAMAERAIEDLSDLFRAALEADRGDATLADEIELGRRYLAIEALRLGSRLQVRWQLPEPLPTLRLPRLILQPVLENAVLHGISQLPAGGEIAIVITRESGRLRVSVRNPVPPQPSPGGHNRHAQQSIGQRLRHRFGADMRLQAGRNGNDYVFQMDLPCHDPTAMAASP